MRGTRMTKVTVQANSTYPLDWRMIVQKQSSSDGVNWSDAGAPVELAPGKKTAVDVGAGSAQAIVSAETNPEFNGRILFGGNAQLRIVTEGWNGEAWYDHAVDEDPQSPENIGPWQNGFRYRIEGK